MLPDSIPSFLWEEFKKHRRKLRAPMTEHAEDLILAKLMQWQAEHGANPIEVIEESIMRGWRGVFLNGHGKLDTTKPAQISPNACKSCGSTTWSRLDRYRNCERCQ